MQREGKCLKWVFFAYSNPLPTTVGNYHKLTFHAIRLFTREESSSIPHRTPPPLIPPLILPLLVPVPVLVQVQVLVPVLVLVPLPLLPLLQILVQVLALVLDL